ncbi:structural maintenance of chromosome 3 (chondroitin sulfate proteoglycan 6) [Sporothrix schenckii 1099-18]|uniref:Structural maintenance of chromosomes protein n=1 Tax=Sporothrix schenckii 1099-18 TaxID=1397361 RepID=A0A0F2MKH6_SPOSC|nr:structural maintenance of chromosome 3 (chondroitin sulfate proteoglycan 6) [Sporothrix schenckii 1099-18]KJR88691.1 structural maintenance of chromosome 3 (chondroitin sulfate proteoglycan 6) [Sporothrix schenckii 1099-18]
MYIKQLIIQGFKSYKDQTVMEPFSPGTNVIVGRNGSGKSNFFAAIRFVLGDAYTQLSREERQALLHEGSGSAVLSAYVEIIFDNSDNRFQTNNREVSLRRTISLRKDEYAVDKKVSTRSEVMSMLDTAGFSLKNSYYIVPQGRVTALTNMKESDRLKLLKEVAGTESYEARRAESLKIMSETENKRAKIDELLEYIRSRMSELEEEKEELRGFQEKDRERRCLEYAFHHHHQVALTEALEEIDRSRQDGADNSGASQKLFLDGENAILRIDSELQELQRSVDILNMDRQEFESECRDISRSKAKAELKVKSLADSQNAVDRARQQHDAELKAVRAEIAAKESQLARILPDLEKRRAAEAEGRQALQSLDARRQRLLNKQSQGDRFKNKSERDRWIDSQLTELNSTLAALRANRVSAAEETEEAKRLIQSLEAEIEDLWKGIESFGSDRTALADKLSKAQDKVQKLDDERRALRREDDKLNTHISNARQERDKASRTLSNMMDNATARGLATIERMKREKDIPGAYGMLADLMEVNEAYRIPAEVIAGNSLFHYVVDNEETSTLLSNALYRQQGGRITFIPLEQLRPRQANFPQGAKDALPLVDKIQFDKKFEKAFQHVFGSTVVCPTVSVAAQYGRSHGVDGITPEGDTTKRTGTMTGGYVDPSRSRLEAIRSMNKWRGEHDSLVAQADDVKRQMDRKEQEVTNARGEEQKILHQMRQLEEGFGPSRAELSAKRAQLERERARQDTLSNRYENINKSMEEYATSLESHEAERKSEFKKALSAAEEQQLDHLNNEVQALQRQVNEATSRRREIEGQKQILDVDLRQNLRMKEDQLTSQVFETMTSVGGDGNYAEAQKELKKLQKRLDEKETRLRETLNEMDEQQAEISDLQANKVELERKQQEIATTLEKSQKRMEKSLQRRALLTQQLAEAAKNIRELGVLPEEAFEKYERMDPSKISKRLKTVLEALKKYRHVNKKAFEQYNSFTNQQEQLLKRREELDASQASIEELVAHLDRVKDESIERTFKQISKEFATIFERLVPAGHGRLVIQRRDGRQQEENGDDDDDEAAGGSSALRRQRRSVESYTGVGISVSFNSKHMDEQQKVQQLSGGQKSLCALCLVFAIQQTDPSPMVVFDEVDANLDAQYRTAVASLLSSISKDAGTQFICTTFRPEIVQVADKCYGVTFTNKTSSIGCVATEEALNFVDGQKQ